MLDDQALLDAYVSRGSSEAFTRLVERHTNLVYGAALRRVGGDPHRARDVSQRVFVDLARKAPRLVRHPLLVGWLHQCTQWAAQNERRAEQRRWRAEQAAAEEAVVTGSGAPTGEWAEVRVVLDEALDALRPADRDAILMRFFQDLSYAEMAGQTGCAENAARMRVERALERLEVILHRKGIRSTALALGGVLAGNTVVAAPPGLAGGLAAQALATSAGGAAGLAGIGLTFLGANLPLILVTTIAGVLTWGLLDARAAVARDRADGEAWESRRAVMARTVEQFERTRRVEAGRLSRLPPLEAMPEPTDLQRERRRLDLIVRKGELDQEYISLFRRLRLPPGPLDRLKELIVDRNQAVYDALQVAKAEGIVLTQANRRQLEREAVAPSDLEIDALLGSDGFQARRFLDTLELRRALMVPEIADARRDATVGELVADLGPSLEAWLGERERAPGYYLPVPESVETELRRVLTPDEIAQRAGMIEVERAGARMIELSREAAYAGKLKLSARSERDYPPPRAGSLPP